MECADITCRGLYQDPLLSAHHEIQGQLNYHSKGIERVVPLGPLCQHFIRRKLRHMFWNNMKDLQPRTTTQKKLKCSAKPRYIENTSLMRTLPAVPAT